MADSGLWWDGDSKEGVHVRIPQDPYLAQWNGNEPHVEVGGEKVKVTGRISRLRDGGTTTIPTSVGVVRVNWRIGTTPSVSIRRSDG